MAGGGGGGEERSRRRVRRADGEALEMMVRNRGGAAAGWASSVATVRGPLAQPM